MENLFPLCANFWNLLEAEPDIFTSLEIKYVETISLTKATKMQTKWNVNCITQQRAVEVRKSRKPTAQRRKSKARELGVGYKIPWLA